MDQQHTFLMLESVVSTEFAESLARSLLAQAEAFRREPAGSFNAGALPSASPSSDWGVAGIIIQLAAQHLDEGLPSGQRERVTRALGALIVGVRMLEAALAPRGVQPSRMLFADPAPLIDALGVKQ